MTNNSSSIVVIDTNIVLLDVYNIKAIWERNDKNILLCLPDTVIEEIDSKKSVIGEVGYQAREFGRLMASAVKVNPLLQASDSFSSVAYEADSMIIHIVSLTRKQEPQSAYENLKNDDKIIQTAKELNAVLITNDVMCKVRAEIRGIATKDFRSVSKIAPVFTKELTVDPRIFKALHGTDIKDIDLEYCSHNYSYMFINVYTKETKLAVIGNKGNIKVIGKETESCIRNQPIQPRNKEQLLLSALIQDATTDIVLCEAIAGSGKNTMAISNAIKLLDDSNTYEGIIYIRNTVDDTSNPDEEIGFLKGNEEKMAVYLHPFFDTLSTIAKARLGKSLAKGTKLHEQVDAEIDALIYKYNMVPMIALGMRGRTFDNSVIIIDEAQNIPKATMQKILSRVGKNCKVIVIGSLRQIDSKYLTRYTSGFSVLLDATTHDNLPINLKAVTLHKVIRGKITEFSEQIFDTKGK